MFQSQAAERKLGETGANSKKHRQLGKKEGNGEAEIWGNRTNMKKWKIRRNRGHRGKKKGK